ncbi:GNAT family N-acetyltransferase [Aquimarina pacifica]|uniref:GNAT family N-acetyltransferase n=1 Tax=Aquimarina pacifica TaxID=1296415 RepID=UPI00046FD73B|nr:GNAT family N-acetyltransferase [Aquimarina pacifica]
MRPKNSNTYRFTTTSSENELEQILTLQQANLPTSISTIEKKEEGFVTVQHTIDILKKMHDRQPHIIAKDQNNVIGYALCMQKEFKDDIEILKPMFSKIDQHVSQPFSYIVMGQICIHKKYRKQGIFRGLYQTMKKELHTSYELLITEVAANNSRSLQAHYAIGFETLITYTSDKTEWIILQWNLK